MFVYILSYNPSAASPSLPQLHTLIEKSREIDSWYFAFGGTYLLKSETNISNLSATFRQFFGDSHFILTHVVPQLIGGLLPQPVWDWVASSPVALTGKAESQ